jgi:hypothetical protein
MPTLIFVDEHNQDAMSHAAGRYLYAGSQVWLEDGLVHYMEGPALLSPDGAQRWYVFGREVTRDVTSFFHQNDWPVAAGLDTDEKRSRFRRRFTH